MFRRAAGLLDFSPRDGQAVELRGRLSLYEARGDLQLVVESMGRIGAGALFEQFLQLKRRLEDEGLFDAAAKRRLPPRPRAIGIVTSLGAAALHDVVTALARRAPQVPLVLSPARVQGAGAATELSDALSKLYHYRTAALKRPGDLSLKTWQEVDLILLVRGGGSIEDLWAFNDERLARTIRASPVPVIVGVGHETDFTIADFAADLRAPTPTAAAELAIAPRADWLDQLERVEKRLRDAIGAQLDLQAQRVDRAALRLCRPSALVSHQRLLLAQRQQRLAGMVTSAVGRERLALQTRQQRFAALASAALRGQQGRLQSLEQRLPAAVHASVREAQERAARAQRSLSLLDPRVVLQRGYAILSGARGAVVTSAADIRPGQALTATLADGRVDMRVLARQGD